MIQLLANESHFADHLRPVRDALPEHLRGTLAEHPEQLDPNVPTVVAAWGSYKQAQRVLHPDTPIAFFEHGAGFRYNTENPHPSYAGGPGRDRVALFCNVNEIVAEANSSAYPNIPSVVVGSPKLDRLATIPTPAPARPATVAFAWHWECKVAPETRTAFPHYRPRLGHVSHDNRQLWTPLGHAHPRGWRWVEPSYRRWQWETEKDFEAVVRRAHVYVCDTSSTIYEMAALDRPVVILNAPWYRRGVQHGLRFWQHLPGPTVDHAGQLAGTIRAALVDDTWQEKRRQVTALVYPHIGEAAQRAADALVRHLT